MTSLRHNSRSDGDPELLDAARASLLAVGWRRTTLTDVARRAGVSRMTMYRRWPDMQTLLADLMTREWAGVVEASALESGSPSPAERLVEGILAAVRALRENALFRKIVEVDPELLLPYLLDRRGRTQDGVLELVAAAIAEGQAAGEIRDGEPQVLARALVLATHGFVLSSQTMTDDPSVGATGDALDAELRHLVAHYLAPDAVPCAPR